jgi:hypothetical protein
MKDFITTSVSVIAAVAIVSPAICFGQERSRAVDIPAPYHCELPDLVRAPALSGDDPLLGQVPLAQLPWIDGLPDPAQSNGYASR